MVDREYKEMLRVMKGIRSNTSIIGILLIVQFLLVLLLVATIAAGA